MSNVNNNGNANGNYASNNWNAARPALIKTKIFKIKVLNNKSLSKQVLIPLRKKKNRVYLMKH